LLADDARREPITAPHDILVVSERRP
jgi:hypothetical protein